MSRWSAWRAALTATAVGVAAAAVVPLVGSSAAQAATPEGFYVKSGKLYESNGSEFVINGVNHPHVWYPQHTSSFAAIKAAGANSVRVVLGGGRWGPNSVADVTNVISLCRTNKLICMLENHDTTGYQEQQGATSLDAAANYWISIASALKGQEKYVLVNIGNEPWGNTGHAGWTAATQGAIKKLRAAGLTHTLVVDAPNWGQDWSGTMKDNAPAVFAADPLANTVFSIHMYGVYNTADKVKAYLDSFVNRGLPIVVGEFGFDHSDGNPDEDTILSYTRQKGLGMMGWSWSGNGGGVEYLDMVQGFNPAQLTTWGQRFINGTDGLKTRGVKEATIYSGVTTTPTTTKPTTTTTRPTTTGPTTTVKPGDGLTVKNGKLYSNGAELVLSGVNHPHVWYPQHTSSFAAIKAAGANSVRVVLGGGRWGPNSVADVKNVISLCKTNKMICVLENHDTTGYQEQQGATSLDAAANYWISIADALKGEEKYVVVNIGNEPWGNTGHAGWTAATQDAIKKLRAAGLTHMLMVDAPNWGQDWSGTMKDNAPAVFAADPLANTVFSIHMYGVYNTADKVKAYLDSFISRGLPIVVGEFGFDHSDGNPDEDTILSYTRQKGLGMMGWSWSGNGGGVEYLDMVQGFNPAQLTTWGQRFINGTDGLKTRGVQEAGVYSGTTTTTSTTTTSKTTTSTTSTSKTTSKKPVKTRTVKKCRTGKNGKKTCKTITKKKAAAAVAQPLIVSPACTVSYTTTDAWRSGSSATVTVTGSGAWTLSYPAGTTVSQVVGSVATVAGSTVSGRGAMSAVVVLGSGAALPTASCA